MPVGKDATENRFASLAPPRRQRTGGVAIWDISTSGASQVGCTVGTPGHSWQLTAQGKTPAAHKGMVHVAKIMAATGVQALCDPALIARAKADLAVRTKDHPYVCPIPADVGPPLDMAAD